MAETDVDTWAESLIGTTIAERYILNKIIGKGAFGVVFGATHTWTERRVAVKVLFLQLAEKTPTARARFLREAKAAASLPHKNIVDVLDMGEAVGTAFMVLELLEGEALSDRMRREAPLSADVTLAILLPVLDALMSAHARELVHRDIKAENIYLHVEDERIIPKIVDFGTVRKPYDENEAKLTAQGALLGTPHYMSPEQVTAKPVTAASDQYACGVLAFALLSGRFPFDGPNPTMILADAVMKPTPTLLSVAPTVAPSIAGAVDKALSKDPAERHADVHAFLDALLAGAKEVGIDVLDPRSRLSTH